jgi:hypothetical protein
MFSAHKHAHYGLVLSIEAGSISAYIVESESVKDAPMITYAVTKSSEGNTDTAHVRNVLKSIAADIELSGRKALALRNPKARLSAVLAIVTPPWSGTIAHTIEFKSETPFSIDAKLLKDLQKAAEDQAAEDPEEQMILGTRSFDTVERAIVDTKVNGYDIDEPIGKEGKLLELTEVTSFVSREVIRAVEETMERIAPEAALSFATHAFVTYRVLRDTYQDDRSFCFVNILPETTEIGIVQKDALLHVSHADYGTATLLRAICQQKNVPQAHIRSQICMYQDGVLDDASLNVVAEHLGPYMDEVAKVFKSIASLHPIPRQLFVLSASPFDAVIEQKIVEALQVANGQTHRLIETEKLQQHQNGTIKESILARYFHKLRLEGAL